jgi:hypothetical protein
MRGLPPVNRFAAVASIGLLMVGLAVAAGQVSAAHSGSHHKRTPTPRPTATITHTPRPTPTPTATAAPTPTGTHSINTVFIILMENHNWSSIKGSAAAPYINNTLLPMASYATQYYNPPGNHPSLPNYLWLESGQCYTYCGTDSDPSQSPNGIGDTQHLVTLLNTAGISWKAYEEDSPDGTCPLSNSGLYAVRHEPFVYYNDVNGNATYCSSHVVNYQSHFGADLAANTVARYNFITPNLCDDMHDTCSPLNNSIKQGDTWLSNSVPAILSSPAYQNGGALFITWDEAASGDGPIGMIVLSPSARGHSYSNSIHYTHSSTLRTMEEIFGLSPLLGDAAHATDLSDLFASFP